MTVGELREALREYPDNLPVVLAMNTGSRMVLTVVEQTARKGSQGWFWTSHRARTHVVVLAPWRMGG